MSGHVGAQLLDALLSVMRAAAAEQPEGQPIRVDDGIPISDLETPDSIAIGSAVDDVAPVIGQREFSVRSHRSSYDITCAVQSWTGDVDAEAISRCRRRAFEVLDLAEAAIRASPRLGLDALVTDSRVTTITYRPVVAEPDDGTVQGVLALVEFTVHIDTYEQEQR